VREVRLCRSLAIQKTLNSHTGTAFYLVQLPGLTYMTRECQCDLECDLARQNNLHLSVYTVN